MKPCTRYKRGEAEFTTTKYAVLAIMRTKLNSKNSLTYGGNIDMLKFDLFNRDIFVNLGSDTVRINVEDVTSLYRGFITWRHRFSQRFSLNTGIHAQYYALNNQAVIEPRLGLQYVINGKQLKPGLWYS